MSDKLRVGLIGCGRWGRLILRDLIALECDVSVVAVSDESRQNAVEGGAAAVVGKTEDLPEIAGAVVASTTVTHALVIESLLARNIPIFTEKPLAPDRKDALRLAGLSPERLFVMDKWRYHHGVEMLAAIARSGEIGAVLGLRTTRAQWGNPHSDVDSLWILAPHDLAITLEILGYIPPARAAVVERLKEQPTGLVGILGDNPWVVIEVSSRFPEHRREIRLQCEAGVAILDDAYSDSVQIARGSQFGSPQIERRAISSELPLLRELSAFVEHLRGGPPPRSSAAEGALIVSRLADLRELAGIV